MRMIFSAVALLLALLAVGWLVKQQLPSLGGSAPAASLTMDADSVPPAAGRSVPPSSPVQQAGAQVEQALAKGMASRASAANQ